MNALDSATKVRQNWAMPEQTETGTCVRVYLDARKGETSIRVLELWIPGAIGFAGAEGPCPPPEDAKLLHKGTGLRGRVYRTR